MPVRSGAYAEIRERIVEAVARFGVAAEIAVGGDSAVLIAPGSRATIELGPLPEQWDNLPDAARRQRCQELARRLVQEYRTQQNRASLAPERGSSSLPPRYTSRPPPARGEALLYALALVALVAISAGGYWMFRPAPPPGPNVTRREVAAAVDRDDSARRQRAAKVCEATRSRVMRGAAVGPTDVEGWVVEIALLRQGSQALATAPELAEFVLKHEDRAGYRVVWSGARTLASEDSPLASLEVQGGEADPGSATAYQSLVLSFGGPYVVAYFTRDRRIELVTLAQNLARRLGADYGALYARCAHQASHHLGSWFYGPTPAGAAAALVFYIGAYGDPPHVQLPLPVEPAKGNTPNGRHATPSVTSPDTAVFEQIRAALDGLERQPIITLLGNDNGMMAGHPNAPQTITFEFGDGNRAARASRRLAEKGAIAVAF